MTTPQSAERGQSSPDGWARQITARAPRQARSAAGKPAKGSVASCAAKLDERIKVATQLTQLAALKAKYDQLCRERDDFRKALEEQLRLNPAFCVMPDPNTEH
jgi:hypothetical protein